MLEDKILNDYKQAMKDRDALKSSALSLLRADLINTAIAKKKDKLEDKDVIAVIKKQIKQRQDSIEQFTKGNRPELAEKETKEMDILKQYLPEELPQEEVIKLIEEVIRASCASGMKDMGKVMKEVTEKIGGRADSKMVSQIVKEKLSV